MKIGLLFEGQGPDLPRLGPDLARVGGRARALVELAASLTGRTPADLWRRGGRALEDTAVYQPVMVAVELGIFHVLRTAGVRPAAVAGHSLGELSAWSAAGGVSPESAVRIAAERGRIMSDRGRQEPGGLLALKGADPGTLERVTAVGREHGDVYVAAVNAPSEWVIGGSDETLRAIGRRFPSTRLRVEGPWHGPPMASVLQEFRRVLDRYATGPLQTRLVSSRSGRVATAAEMPDLVAEQLTRPVQWVDALRSLLELGVTALVTVGPGRVMRGLAYRNGLTDLPIHSTDTPALLSRTVHALGN